MIRWIPSVPEGPTAPAAPSAPPTASFLGRPAALVMDASARRRRQMSAVLEGLGFSAFSAASPEDARAVVRELFGPLDLLLLGTVRSRDPADELVDHLRQRDPEVAVVRLPEPASAGPRSAPPPSLQPEDLAQEVTQALRL